MQKALNRRDANYKNSDLKDNKWQSIVVQPGWLGGCCSDFSDEVLASVKMLRTVSQFQLLFVFVLLSVLSKHFFCEFVSRCLSRIHAVAGLKSFFNGNIFAFLCCLSVTHPVCKGLQTFPSVLCAAFLSRAERRTLYRHTHTHTLETGCF